MDVACCGISVVNSLKCHFLFQIWPTSSLTAIESVLVVLAAQVRVPLYIFLNTNYRLFLPHNYTITTVYK